MKTNRIFSRIRHAAIAETLGITKPRVSWMTRHLEDGDNRERIKTAVLKIREEIDEFLAAP